MARWDSTQPQPGDDPEDDQGFGARRNGRTRRRAAAEADDEANEPAVTRGIRGRTRALTEVVHGILALAVLAGTGCRHDGGWY